MHDLSRRRRRLDVQQNTDATRHRARYRNFGCAKERDVLHSKGTGRLGGKGAGEIRRRGEDYGDDIVELRDAVLFDDRVQEFPRRREHLLRIVVVDRRCAANPANRHSASFS